MRIGRFVVAVAGSIAFLLLVTSPSSEISSQSAPFHSAEAQCNNAANCRLLGDEALGKGDSDSAIRYFREMAAHAEDAHDKKCMLDAYNELARIYLRKGSYFHAMAWTRVALRFDPPNNIANGNLRKIKQLADSVTWPREVTGVYVQYAGRTQWNSLCAQQKNRTSMDFQLLVFRMGPGWKSYGAASYGDLEGRADFAGTKKASYRGAGDFPSCHLDILFGEGSAVLSQQGDCGFGYGVEAEGEYERITPNVNLGNCGELELP